MMTFVITLISVLAIVLAVAFATLFRALRTSIEGYESDAGFHPGPQPSNLASIRQPAQAAAAYVFSSSVATPTRRNKKRRELNPIPNIPVTTEH